MNERSDGLEMTSTDLFGTWIAEGSKKPPRLECYGEFWRSEPVLVTDGKHQWVGYLQSLDNEEYTLSWKMAGPDGWEITGVTHWMPLPPLPNAGGES
jgi:hypothetical protein